MIETKEEPTESREDESEYDEFHELYIDSTEQMEDKPIDRQIVQVEVGKWMFRFNVGTSSDVNIMCML